MNGQSLHHRRASGVGATPPFAFGKDGCPAEPAVGIFVAAGHDASSFPRKRESTLPGKYWTPAFAGVTLSRG